MDLHRASAHPDWTSTAPTARNMWQRLAARTSGVVTPGNVITLAGLVFVSLGVVVFGQHRLTGLMLIGAGRAADVADGMIAAATGTKSRLGEALDASADKLSLFAVLAVLIVQRVLIVWFVAPLGLQALVMVALSLIAHARRRTLHPVRAGKITTTLAWIGLFAVGISALLVPRSTAHHLLAVTGYAVLLVAFVPGLSALRQSISVVTLPKPLGDH